MGRVADLDESPDGAEPALAGTTYRGCSAWQLPRAAPCDGGRERVRERRCPTRFRQRPSQQVVPTSWLIGQSEMVRAGAVLNLFCVIVLTLWGYFLLR